MRCRRSQRLARSYLDATANDGQRQGAVSRGLHLQQVCGGVLAHCTAEQVAHDAVGHDASQYTHRTQTLKLWAVIAAPDLLVWFLPAFVMVGRQLPTPRSCVLDILSCAKQVPAMQAAVAGAHPESRQSRAHWQERLI